MADGSVGDGPRSTVHGDAGASAAMSVLLLLLPLHHNTSPPHYHPWPPTSKTHLSSPRREPRIAPSSKVCQTLHFAPPNAPDMR